MARPGHHQGLVGNPWLRLALALQAPEELCLATGSKDSFSGGCVVTRSDSDNRILAFYVIN
jgi:hypothetical protein